MIEPESRIAMVKYQTGEQVATENSEISADQALEYVLQTVAEVQQGLVEVESAMNGLRAVARN